MPQTSENSTFNNAELASSVGVATSRSSTGAFGDGIRATMGIANKVAIASGHLGQDNLLGC